MATVNLKKLKEELERLYNETEFDKAREKLYIAEDQALQAGDEKLKKKIHTKLLSFHKLRQVIKGKPIRQYLLSLDTMTEGLESSYYWIIAYAGDTFFNQKLEFTKAQDYFAATETSYMFGEMGARRTNLEKRAQELLALINQLVRTIINILWDLREFELRIQRYRDLQSPDKDVRRSADLALKSIWLSEVDMKKGAGSINNLVQQLNFVTLRDAFMFIDTMQDKERALKGIGEKEDEGMDLPMIVKRILRARVTEYMDWRKLSEDELVKRFEIEKAYLNHEVASMKLYTAWARPYLYATKKLMMPEHEALKERMPHIEWGTIHHIPVELVTAFETAHIFVELFGTRKMTPEDWKLSDIDDDIYAAVEIDFIFRTLPGQVEQRRYLQRGNLDMVLTAYAIDKRRKEDLKAVDEDEVLYAATRMTQDTLDKLKNDLEHFGITDETTEKELEVAAVAKPSPFSIFGESLKPFSEVAEGLKKFLPAAGGKKPADPWKKQRALKIAAGKAADIADATYDKYKKAKGMYTWI